MLDENLVAKVERDVKQKGSWGASAAAYHPRISALVKALSSGTKELCLLN